MISLSCAVTRPEFSQILLSAPTLSINACSADCQPIPEYLRAASGVYALRFDAAPPHLSSTNRLGRRMERLLASGLKGLKQIDCWAVYSRLESSLVLYALSKECFPDTYWQRLRLRHPWFVGLSEDRFPKLILQPKSHRAGAATYGPFATRDEAEHYQRSVQGLFQLRQCPDPLEPSPEHPGCIYGEMNHCMRPCQLAASDSEYASEAQRTAEFLATNGRGLVTGLSLARDRATEQLEFEEAAQIHKRIERARAAAAARSEWVQAVQSFAGVALVRGPKENCFRLFPFVNGSWQPFVSIAVGDPGDARPLDARLREALASGLADAPQAGNRDEHMALFLRWYRSTWRDGEWFPFRTLADLNYRKLVREISKRAKDGARDNSSGTLAAT